MKRKFFSTLLMVIFVLGAIGTVSSCKDYDDDINGVQTEVNTLKTQLTTLQQALEKAKQEATEAHATFMTKTEANEKLEALKKEMAKLVTADALQEAIDKVNEAMKGKADKAELDKLAQRIDAIDASLNKLGVTSLENLVSAIEAAKKNIENQQKALDNLAAKVDGKIGNAELQKAIADLKKELKGTNVGDATSLDELKKQMNDLDAKVKKFSPQIDILTVLVNKKLSMLVLKPAFYWEGLAGIEVPHLVAGTHKFGDKTVFTYRLVNTPTGDPDVKVTVFQKLPEVTPNYVVPVTATAYYHMDPSTSSLEGAEFSFFTNEAEVYTRAGEPFAKPLETTYKAGGKNVVKDGVLAVPFDVNKKQLDGYYTAWLGSANTDPKPGSTLYNWDDEDGKSFGGKLPFVSLQAKFPAKDGVDAFTVTSDYAVVTPAEYSLVALGDKAPEDIIEKQPSYFKAVNKNMVRDNWLYTRYYNPDQEATTKYYCVDAADPKSPAHNGVITMPASHSVVYTETIDLKPLIETHYNYTTFAKYGKSTKNKIMTDEQLAALGLHYEFTPVDYILGTNKTSETAHFEQIGDKTSGVFAPRSVNADGTTIKGQVAKKEVIGREPLVRVDLVDAKGKILLYGYIKVRIVAAKPEGMKAEVDLDHIYMNCGDEGRTTWSQIENLILHKLGNDGMTKQEFEQAYYLEVKDGHTVMPSGKDPYVAGWEAVRYTEPDVTKLATKPEDLLGKVWYTPHDNATNPHSWDAQTNVLLWNLTKSHGGLDAKKIALFIKTVNATYASKGLNQKVFFTWVRFINKNNGSSIWVKLNFPVGKIHFAYGSINNKDLHHWYKFNSTYAAGMQSDLDVHANVPTPAEKSQVALTATEFDKDVREYWLDKKAILTLESEKDKFDKFYDADGHVKNVLDFAFVLPQKGVNSTISAVNNQWVVRGASGSKWTLELGDDNHTIYAVAQDGTAIKKEKVVELRKNADDNKYSIVHYFGLEGGNYNAATDLLNNMGRYDAMGKDIKADYLTNNIDKTFTAYMRVTASETPCYVPILGNDKFNVRFMRPINVWAKNIAWTDALNNKESVDLQDLVTIKDWREYNVIVDASYSDQTKEIPYKFYGISSLSVIREKILTDAPFEESIRKADALKGADAIAKALKAGKLKYIDNVPSLTSYEFNGTVTTATYLKLFNGKDQEVYNSKVHGVGPGGVWTEGQGFTKFGRIEYTNNGAGAQIFHIYVPIAVNYNWGNVINNMTNLATSGVKKDLDYTQVVWAVITVNKTTGSGAAKAFK